MNSFLEILVGKPVRDWTRMNHWSVRLLAGVLAFGLFLLLYIFRQFLNPWWRTFWPDRKSVV